MCILPDWQIVSWARNGGIRPFNPECVNPASIDLTWSGRYRIALPSNEPVYLSNPKCNWSEVIDTNILHLKYGEFYLLDTEEKVSIPDVLSAMLFLKSTSGRSAVEQAHAGFFDPGFQGTATLEITLLYPWDVIVEKGQRIVQLVLIKNAGTPDKLYQGRYLGQTEPTGARSVK